MNSDDVNTRKRNLQSIYNSTEYPADSAQPKKVTKTHLAASPGGEVIQVFPHLTVWLTMKKAKDFKWPINGGPGYDHSAIPIEKREGLTEPQWALSSERVPCL
jgi:hypothetical protein